MGQGFTHGIWAWECGSEAGVHSWAGSVGVGQGFTHGIWAWECGSEAGVHSWDHGPGSVGVSVGVRQGFTHGIMGLGVWE